MKNLILRLTLLASFAVLPFGFIGCSGGESEETDTEQALQDAAKAAEQDAQEMADKVEEATQ